MHVADRLIDTGIAEQNHFIEFFNFVVIDLILMKVMIVKLSTKLRQIAALILDSFLLVW